jgi:hypothetical protein
MDAYIENCRNLNEQLRAAHETERKAWEIERTSLKSRIAELEFQLKKSRDPRRRSSNDSSATSAQSFRADFGAQWSSNGSGSGSGSAITNGGRKASDSALITGPPVWRGPESTPPVTRVFSHDDDVYHLPSISEDEPFPTLSKEVSPTNKEEAVPIPIEQVEPTLDGITLKSTGPALTSSFVAKISSPQFSPSPARSPSPRPPRNTLSAGSGAPVNLNVDMKNLLDPLDEKLKRHAGHTPMAFDGQISTSATTTTIPSPKVEKPPEPVPSARPPIRPSENADSYFSNTNVPQVEPPPAVEEEKLEPQDDPALKGPLMLDPNAKSQAAHTFLDQVDAKLLAAAEEAETTRTHGRGRSETLQTDDGMGGTLAPMATVISTNGSKPEKEREHDAIWEDDEGHGDRNGRRSNGSGKGIDDDMPRLKMKSSKNFGSAWGHVPGVSNQ